MTQVCVRVPACVCVCERERARARETTLLRNPPQLQSSSVISQPKLRLKAGKTASHVTLTWLQLLQMFARPRQV